MRKFRNMVMQDHTAIHVLSFNDVDLRRASFPAYRQVYESG
jgi:hypothetical protein